jgi:hypothetical protein
MKTLFLFFFTISALYAKNPSQIIIEPENWIGLGFFMALYPELESPQHYRDCYSDDKLFMALPVRSWQGEILAATGWLDDKILVLQSREQKEIYCRMNNNGIIPELVFFKELLDAGTLYKNKKVWSKVDFFHIPDNQRQGKRYPLRKFEPLTVIDVEPAPVSEHNSVRIFCRVLRTSMEGYFDVSLTGINRIPPMKSFAEHCFLENPQEIFQMSEAVWKAAREKRIIIGTPAEVVKIILGPPLTSREDRGEILRLFYPSTKRGRSEYIFFRNKLLRVIRSQDDEFPESRLF